MSLRTVELASEFSNPVDAVKQTILSGYFCSGRRVACFFAAVRIFLAATGAAVGYGGPSASARISASVKVSASK